MLGQLAKDKQGDRTISHAKWIASSIYKHAIATGFASQNPWPNAQCLVKTAYSDDVNGGFQRDVNGHSGDVNKVGAQRRWDYNHAR